jgi:membrane dipeptidase
MMGGQFWSVYVPATFTGSEGLRAVMEQIDLVHRMVARYPDAFGLALTADDVERIHKQGKVASMIGMEGGHSIANSLAALRLLYDLGARYMTITHSAHIDWADSCMGEPRVGGLSPFGKEVVREMNRMGMLVDLSHVAPVTMHAALDTVEAPVIFSHSSARAVTENTRNVPDDVLARLPQNGGVVMVTFVPGFISNKVNEHEKLRREHETKLKDQFPGEPDKIEAELKTWEAANPGPSASLADAADHIDHIRKIAGIDHVGIGGDYDGITSVPVGLEDVSKYPDLFAELLRRGYSKDDIKKIAGLNLLRVMHAAEAKAAELQKSRRASDVLIEEVDSPLPQSESTPRLPIQR